MSIDIPKFEKTHVLVVGDVMLDRYWHGPASRISPEAPVPVVRIEEREERPGGAGNVALNIAALGGKATLMGVTGNDETGRMLQSLLEAAGVDCRFEQLGQIPTITKLRVISRHQQLIRVDFEEGFLDFDATGMLSEFTQLLASVDVVVLSDYGKGSLTDPQFLIQSARIAGKPVLVDPKGNDFSRYRGASMITPNLAELEAAVGPCCGDQEIETKGRSLMSELAIEALLITRGEQGMTLLQRGQPTRHLPTHAREVFDVTGAGDTVISVLAAGLAAGLSRPMATRLSNVAAGMVVAKLGTASVSAGELAAAVLEHHTAARGVISEAQLVSALDTVRSQGEKIVLTNGCFDILHAGHVSYLEQASRLGDRLVVAVNVDQTVRDLKGPDRPVNSLERRMTVLAALACVDWVVPFVEQTPERLICRLQPDFLVKGGDNDPDSIPGSECVRESGGKVMVMEYLENCSTTGLIEAIREND